MAVAVALADIVTRPPPVIVKLAEALVDSALVEVVMVVPEKAVMYVPVTNCGPVSVIPTSIPATGATPVMELEAAVVAPVAARLNVPFDIDRMVVPAGMPAPVIVMPGWKPDRIGAELPTLVRSERSPGEPAVVLPKFALVVKLDTSSQPIKFPVPRKPGCRNMMRLPAPKTSGGVHAPLVAATAGRTALDRPLMVSRALPATS